MPRVIRIGRANRSAIQTQPGQYDDEGRLETTVSGIPPIAVSDKQVVFSQFFTLDGDPLSSNDLRTDGSVTPVDFIVPAHATRDRYIASLFFVIADAGAALNEFGNIGALTNGCRLIYSRADVGEVEIEPTGLHSNFDFIRLAAANPSFGDAGTAFRATNVVGSSEAFLAHVNFHLTHGMYYGMRLRANTDAKLILRVQDDITAIDGFTCRATGFERLPD
jgi:hypothetical protein